MNTSTSKTSYFKAPHETEKFFYRKTLTKAKPFRPVVFVHGAFEHSGRYHHLTSKLQKKGYSSFGFDLRGHGKSPGRKGDARSVDQLTEDLENFIAYLKKQYEIDKFILIGHSLGGLISLNYTLKKENQKKLLGLYVSAPALSVRITPSMKIKRFLGEKFLIKITPQLRLPVGLSLETLTHDPVELEKYKKDPLIFDLMSIRLAMDILKKGDEVTQKVSQIKELPIFFAHGNGDKISYDRGTQEAYKKLSSPNKKLMIYPGYYHELFNEDLERRTKVLNDLIDWCETLYK